MRIFFRLSLLLIFPIILSHCAGTYQSRFAVSPVENLAHQIDLQIAMPELETALVGIMVQSAATGEILYQHNPHTVMLPASNEKILTSAAALVKLGPDFRYQTGVYATGNIENGVFKGDLIIVGSGDPTLSYRFCDNPDSFFIFHTWADSLKAKGILTIDGDIIGVDNVFDDEPICYGWSVGDLSYGYSAPIGGLIFNENMAQVTIKADSAGKKVNIAVTPDFGYLEIDPKLGISANETKIVIERVAETNRIQITGTIEPGKSYTESVSIHDPTLYFLNGLIWELNQHGIKMLGKPIDADSLTDPEKLSRTKLLFSSTSPPFSDVLKVLMKESQNLYAESLVKLLGHHLGKEGSFDEGAKIVKQTLNRFGLKEDSYSYKDGSGLSRYNYISPAQLVKILRNMYFHPYGKIYQQCLPIAGVDGTIGYRMKGTIAEGKIIAKTGTVSNVRCLSGYALTRDDETLVFSTMFNNFLCDVNVIMEVQDRICMLLSSFSRNR